MSKPSFIISGEMTDTDSTQKYSAGGLLEETSRILFWREGKEKEKK